MKRRFAGTLCLVLLMTAGTILAQDDLALAPRITMDDLGKLMASGKVKVIDVRDAGTYMTGHLPGAILMPLADIQTRWKELPTDRPIVAYCS